MTRRYRGNLCDIKKLREGTMAKLNLKRSTDWLVIIGALNWGLTVLNFNVVEWLSGLLNMPQLTTLLYSLIGIAAVFRITNLLK